MKYFDLSELTEAVGHQTDTDEGTVREILDAAFEIIAQRLAFGKVGLKGLGEFTLVPRAYRKFTLGGKEYEIPEHRDVKFNPYPKMLEKVNAGMLEGDLPTRLSQD
jgi:nucleoid DNA-binding protein